MSYSKRRAVLAAVTIVLVLTVLPSAIALADCRITSTTNGNDTVSCTDPDDTNGISTGGGNDTITVAADTEVRSSGTTIDTGSGNDTVTNRGRVRSTGGDPINFRAGVDTLHNYGYIEGYDDGVWCTPYSGHTCTFNNYSGATIVARNEAIDISNSGGTMVVNNWGTIRSTYQEAMHFHSSSGGTYQVDNRGTVQGQRNAIEVYQARVTVTNSGTIYSTNQTGIWSNIYNDSVTNSGMIRSDRDPAVYLYSGSDTLTNRGTIQATNDSSGWAAVQMGSGNDVVTNSGNIRELGSGYASIALESGNDQITIQGGQINRSISGGDGTDVLTFQFNGTTSEVDTFRRRVNTQSPGGGSATWRSNTYQWTRFETIRMILNGVTYTRSASTSTASADTMSTESMEAQVEGTAQDGTIDATQEPTVEPTAEVTAEPTAEPTSEPTDQPTEEPTPLPTEEPAPPVIVLAEGYYEDSVEGLVYTGNWAHYTKHGASGDGYMRTSDPSAEVRFSFEGTRLTLYRTIYGNRGAMEVCLDGVCQIVENRGRRLELAAPVTFEVAAGVHEVVIRNLSDRYIDLDAVLIENIPTEETSAVVEPEPTAEPTQEGGGSDN